jgi:hypothetical protein
VRGGFFVACLAASPPNMREKYSREKYANSKSTGSKRPIGTEDQIEVSGAEEQSV